VSKKNRPAASGKIFGNGPVTYTFATGGSDLASPVNLNIDFRRATPPETYIYANSVSLTNDTEIGMVSLLFANQQVSTGTKSCEALNLTIPATSLFGQFLGTASPVEQSLVQILEAGGLETARREVSKDCLIRATLFANVVSVYTGLLDCCIDFYYMPIRDIHLAKQFQTAIGLEPVLRVLLPPAVLKYLFEQCHQFEPEKGSRADVRGESRAITR